MGGLAAFIVRGPWQAVMVASVAAVVSMLAPPISWVFAYVSGATIALVTLKIGARQGIQVTLGAALAAALLTWLTVRNPFLGVAFALLLWAPVWLIAMVLRGTASLALAIQTAVALGIVAVLAVFMVVGDPAAAWLGLLEQLRPTFEQAQVFQDSAQLDEALRLGARIMTGASVAYAVLGVILALLLGRAWHAKLDNPSGFGQEFRALRLDQVSGLVALGVTLAAVLTRQALLVNLVWVLVVGYLFHGLAVAHNLFGRTRAPGWWLSGMYVATMVFIPSSLLVLALAGLSDTWLNFRRDRTRSDTK